MKKLDFRRLLLVFLAFCVITEGTLYLLTSIVGNFESPFRPLTWVVALLFGFITGLLITTGDHPPVVFEKRRLVRMAIPVILLIIAHEAIMFVTQAHTGASVPLLNGWITLESDFRPLPERGLSRWILVVGLPLLLAGSLYIFPRRFNKYKGMPHAFVMGSLATTGLCLLIDWIMYQGISGYVRLGTNVSINIPGVCALLASGSIMYGLLNERLSEWEKEKRAGKPSLPVVGRTNNPPAA